MWVAVVSDISPALVVRHHENDVGTTRLFALVLPLPCARLDCPRRESGDEQEQNEEDSGGPGSHEKAERKIP
jgi:hypothetical protein